MRTWLYDTLTQSSTLQSDLGGASGILTRVMPRRSEENISNIDVPRPFIIYGLGNSTNEGLEDPTANDASAERQFFQIWIHDDSGSYVQIDRIAKVVRKLLVGGQHKPSRLVTVAYLETSQEFNNETYGTIFRYIRFQAILAEGKALA